MRGACGRPGCEEPATATFGFDGGRAVVWLHPIDEPEGSGLLCSRHADALVVPRGWTLHDRRKARRKKSPPGAAKPRAAEKPSVAPAPPTLPFPERPARALRRPAWAQRDAADDPVGALLEAGSPLLSRAFRNARPS